MNITDMQTDYRDPIAQAVVDNVMGRLPNKKEKVLVTCSVCNLDFASQIPFEMHLKGARHAKRLKSQEISENLKDGGERFDQDPTNNNLKCDVCAVTVNSFQQLQTHLAGSKHKQKSLKRSGTPMDVTPSKRSALSANLLSVGYQGENGDGVRPVTEGLPNKTWKYFCEPCAVTLNSENQMKQHITSKKHLDKTSKISSTPETSGQVSGSTRNAIPKREIAPPIWPRSGPRKLQDFFVHGETLM